MQWNFWVQVPKGALQAQTAPTEWQFHEFYCNVCTEPNLEDLMPDPKMPEPAEDVDLDDDSQDGSSEYGSGNKGDTLQDFIETLYYNFPFLRTENYPHADFKQRFRISEKFSIHFEKRAPDTSIQSSHICLQMAKRHANDAKFLCEQSILHLQQLGCIIMSGHSVVVKRTALCMAAAQTHQAVYKRLHNASFESLQGLEQDNACQRGSDKQDYHLSSINWYWNLWQEASWFHQFRQC